ncbi:glycosyltransferase family 4 protein [Nocardioides dongkuii]|uniref:glycosyltransferase family 4 protein n=1 Tax=Nocardioides dongkuii TaxID=2760089 RepID=UPI0015F960DC|nr:glycosyltransferase family 1 protein [Nocardioides dongkuii]
MTLLVDVRREGEHGIARYTREVVTRLTVPFEPLEGPAPRLPLDALTWRRGTLQAHDWVYSPGYVCSPSRARQVVTLHDLIHLGHGSWKYRTYYDRVIRPAVRRAGHVFTVSAASASRIRDWVGPGVTVHDCGNGCSEVFHAPTEPAVRPTPYLLMVGNARPHKNIGVALQALRRVPDVGLVFVTQERDQVRAAAAAAGVLDRVEVLEGLSDPDLARLYAGAVALVFPSLEEGFGLPLVEAAAVGCATVFYAGCAASREVCGEAGIAVGSADDPAEWASALTAVLDSPDVPLPDVSTHTWDAVGARVDATLRDITGLSRTT